MNGTHVVIKDSERVPLPGAVAAGRTSPHTKIEVTLKLRPKRRLPALLRRPRAKLNRDQLTEELGASHEDLEKVVQEFARYGLSATARDPMTRTVELTGTVAAAEKAFQVKLFNYVHPRGNYRGRVGHVRVPRALGGIVEGVFGLDNRRAVKLRRRPARIGAQGRALGAPPSWWLPSQLAEHYNFPPGDGKGQTVGLLEFGGGYFPADLQSYCQVAQVPVPSVATVSVDGTPTNARDGAEGEVMLDVEIIAGLCPAAQIVVYFAEWTEQGWIRALDSVIRDRTRDPGVVSISWGEAEGGDIWTAQAMQQINASLQDASRLGITVCVAAGDDGSSDALSDGLAHVNFPASSPFVLSVGGTTITAGQTVDVVWKEGDGLRADGGGCTGGGVSSVFRRPPWQANLPVPSVNPGQFSGRILPDVAANADWDASPYLLVVDGQAQPNGGTSAASPLWAGLITRLNAQRGSGNRLGYLTPTLYQSQNGAGSAAIGAVGCTDVISGENATGRAEGYAATVGYDAASGWGIPNGTRLAAALPP